MIFITGCARSGTSLNAGIVARSGAWGQYENEEIRDTTSKPILKMLGAGTVSRHS